MRLKPAVAVVVGLLALGTAPAFGQWRNMDNRSLTSQDFDLMNAAADRLGDGAVGAEESWENPESRNRGRLMIVDRDTQDSLPCRTIAHRVEIMTTQESFIVEARTCFKDGQWRLATR
jgi:hypothetical protein